MILLSDAYTVGFTKSLKRFIKTGFDTNSLYKYFDIMHILNY